MSISASAPVQATQEKPILRPSAQSLAAALNDCDCVIRATCPERGGDASVVMLRPPWVSYTPALKPPSRRRFVGRAARKTALSGLPAAAHNTAWQPAAANAVMISGCPQS